MTRTRRPLSGTPRLRGEFTTRFSFDAFGRMQYLVYPDGEVLSYQYDRGGLLKGARSDFFGMAATYLKSLTYDQFGQLTANPAVRPGMEGQPKEVIEAAQQSRIRHLEKEIQTFKENIEKLTGGG